MWLYRYRWVWLWTAGVRALARVAKRYPQTAYAGFVWSLQAEWTYLLRVSERAGPLLAPVEEAIRGEFLPALLGRQVVLDDDQRVLMSLAAKHGGLGIRNPVVAAESLQKASEQASRVLVDALMGDAELDLVEHAKCVRWARTGAQGERREREEAFLADYGRRKGPKVAKRLRRLMDGSAWLTRVPSRLDGTQLTKLEWHDVVSLRYGFRPAGLIQQCDGCGANFSVGHALSCKKGGLIGWRHNDTRDEWAWLCSKALPPSHVSTEPLINDGARAGARAGPTGEAAAANSGADAGAEWRGDVSARSFWRGRRRAIFDVRITDTDAPSYGNRSTEKILAAHEKEKDDRYGIACRVQQKDFTPLVYSVDGMPGKQARSAERRLAQILAAKWGRQYSDVVNFVRCRMSLSVVRSISLVLRTERQTLPWVRRAPDASEAAFVGRVLD